jgi:hypothetical protein
MVAPTSEMIRTALELAIQQEDDVRLVSSGARAPGLFQGGPSKLKTEAINACLNSGFLEKTRAMEVGKGSRKKPVDFVRITAAGMKALFESVPISRGKEILAGVPRAHREAADGAFRAFAMAELQKRESELSRLFAEERHLFAMIAEMVGERAKMLGEWKSSVLAAIEETRTVVSPQETGDRNEGKVPPGRKTPDSHADLDFQRDQSEQLVFAWQDADATTKEALENVMYNVGLEAVGERGQVLPFDGRIHDTDEEVLADTSVVVTEPGWRLANSRGVYLITKARVTRMGAEQCPAPA